MPSVILLLRSLRFRSAMLPASAVRHAAKPSVAVAGHRWRCRRKANCCWTEIGIVTGTGIARKPVGFAAASSNSAGHAITAVPAVLLHDSAAPVDASAAPVRGVSVPLSSALHGAPGSAGPELAPPVGEPVLLAYSLLRFVAGSRHHRRYWVSHNGSQAAPSPSRIAHAGLHVPAERHRHHHRHRLAAC